MPSLPLFPYATVMECQHNWLPHCEDLRIFNLQESSSIKTTAQLSECKRKCASASLKAWIPVVAVAVVTVDPPASHRNMSGSSALRGHPFYTNEDIAVYGPDWLGTASQSLSAWQATTAAAANT